MKLISFRTRARPQTLCWRRTEKDSGEDEETLTRFNQSLGTSLTVLSAYRSLMKKSSELYQHNIPRFTVTLRQRTQTKHSVSARVRTFP